MSEADTSSPNPASPSLIAGRSPGFDAAAGFLLLVSVTLFFVVRISGTVAAGVVDNVVLGGDPAARLQAFIDARYWRMGYELHPLACAWALVTAGPLHLLGVDDRLSAAISIALAVGLGSTLLFSALRLWSVPRRGALACVALTLSAFAMITGFSIVDTYAVTFCAICFALCAVLVIARRYAVDSGRAVALAGIALTLPSMANLPATAYAGLYMGLVWDVTRDLRRVVKAGTGAAAIAIAAGGGWLAVTRLAFDYDSSGVISNFASVGHFSGRELGDAIASLLAFAFVAPDADLRCRYLSDALTDYEGIRLMTMAGWWLVLGAGIVSSARHGAGRGLLLAATAAVAALAAFYIYFAPEVMLLYFPQFAPALALALGALVLRFPRAWSGIALLAAATMIVNAPVLWSVDLTTFAASCPPALQVNGAL